MSSYFRTFQNLRFYKVDISVENMTALSIVFAALDVSHTLLHSLAILSALRMVEEANRGMAMVTWVRVQYLDTRQFSQTKFERSSEEEFAWFHQYGRLCEGNFQD